MARSGPSVQEMSGTIWRRRAMRGEAWPELVRFGGRGLAGETSRGMTRRGLVGYGG